MDSKEMVGNEFRKNALRTEPSPEAYEKVFKRLNHPPVGVTLISTLMVIQKHIENLDEIKKYLFYGKESPFLCKMEKDISPNGSVNFPDMEERVEQAKTFADPKLVRLLHGVIGMNTEGGELIEALLKVSKGEDADTVNFMEEVADTNWYEEIIGDTLGFSIPQANARVIAKLMKRFPDKFTEDDAINRDLNQERQTLEGREL